MRLTKFLLPVLGLAVAVALLAGPATADPPSGVPGGPCIEGEQQVQLSSLPSYEEVGAAAQLDRELQPGRG
jgi:hypothetical protein